MSRKLGRLLVVALVVAAVVGPATLSAAIDLPTCGGITYSPGDPSHILYPTDVGAIKQFYDHADVWDEVSPPALINYLNVDLSGMAGPLVVFPDKDALEGLTWAGKFEAVRIVGTSGDDIICGYSNTALTVWGSVVKGAQGNDTIYGGTADDSFNVLVGGPGNDMIVGLPGTFDGVLGGAGADVIYGAKTTAGPYPYISAYGDDLFGGAGGDTIVGGGGDDFVGGQGGDDTLMGDLGADKIVGGAGADMIYGVVSGSYENTDDGGNFLIGMAGNDTIIGGGGGDLIRGGAGDDTIKGNSGPNHIDGGLGNDSITGGVDSDWLYGGPGNDTIHGGSGPDLLFGDAGAPYGPGHPFYGLEGVDSLYGDNDSDVMFGGLGADTLYGGLGDDMLLGAYSPSACASEDDAADTMYGDYGDDWFYGAVGDLDSAYEQYEAGSDDYSFNVDIIPMGNVEHVLFGPGVCF
jgi:Ca2+-binding RTX toxin-like protein